MNANVLGQLRSRAARWLALRWLLVLGAIVGALALSAVLADAALALPDQARVLALFLLGLGALAVVIASICSLRRIDSLHVARSFERVEPGLGDRLTNAVQLHDQAAPTSTGEVLRREAVELGRKSAAGLRAWQMMRRPIKGALLALAAVGVCWSMAVWLGGDVLASVLPRFADPFGDHPPYSRLKIDVSPKRGDVLYGGQLEIKATTRGRPVEKLWLVARAGRNETRTMMFLAPDRSFFQTLANLREPTTFFVTDGAARSRRFPIQVRYTPQITLVEVTTTFPEYTGRAPRTTALADEPQTLPADTRVAFRVVSNRPLSAGELSITPVLGGAARRVPLQVGNQSNVVTGEFTLAESSAVSLSVRDTGGLTCAEPRGARLNLLPDERPRVFVLEPGRHAVATATTKIPVRVQAQDDYGVTQVAWLRGHNRSIERPFNMKLELKNGPALVESSSSFDLEKLGVRTGDVIEYYFEAADNYPRGPNLALSRMYRLEIISAEQYQEILRRAAARKALFEPYFKMGAWLRRLAERSRNLEKKANTGASSEELSREAAELARDLDKYEEELGKVLQQAAMFDVEQAFRETLVIQHTRFSNAKKNFKDGIARGPPGPKNISELSKELEDLAGEEEEEIGEPARQIASAAQLVARADTFVKLAREEALLAQMLRRFADKAEPLTRIEQMEVQELAHQQRRIQEELAKLLASLPELAAQLPEGEQFEPLRKDVASFIDAVKQAKIEDDLASASKALGEPDAMTGHALAQIAAEKMDKLIARCEQQMPGQARQCLRFQPKLQTGLGNTLEQILAAMGVGNGDGGRDGYGLFNDDVALYGPNAEVAGEQAGGRNDRGGTTSARGERLGPDTGDGPGKTPEMAGRVRLRPDAKFPLRYREVVGEYFRAIAESEVNEGGVKP